MKLATRIEAGLYAAERVRRAEDVSEELSAQLRRDLRWIVRDGDPRRCATTSTDTGTPVPEGISTAYHLGHACSQDETRGLWRLR